MDITHGNEATRDGDWRMVRPLLGIREECNPTGLTGVRVYSYTYE